ncbi:hypothetical protein ACIQCG_00765 [Streptomyces noursei]|uniref:hypothetical protein n=1 Tax=Streptomyces noursei TaxID=1971 RepID=UPI00382C09C6
MPPATATAHYARDTAPVVSGPLALIVPSPESAELQQHYRSHDQGFVTVSPPAHTLPPGAATPSPDATNTVLHQGLRSTARQLRALGVSGIVPGSSQGVDLAARLAEQLDLPGNEPSTSMVRRDRDAQAKAWSRAGLPSARTVRSTSLPTALRWARFVNVPQLVVAPADTSVSGPARTCRAHAEIGLAWVPIRRAAHHHSGSRHVVLQERIAGRQYTVRTTTAEGQHTVTEIWALTHTPAGLLDRADLLPASSILNRPLKHLAGHALTALGVRHGAMRLRLAHHPERGPVLLSARVDVTPTHPRPAARLHTTRVTLHAPADGVLNRRLLRTVIQLPTVYRIEGELQPGVPITQTHNRHTSPGVVELVGGPAAVRADHDMIRRLEARGLYAQFGDTL